MKILLLYAIIFALSSPIGVWMGIRLDRRKQLSWERKPKPKPSNELHHTLIVGKSGSGKSTSVRNNILAAAVANQSFILLCDPHGQLADDVLCDLLPRGFEDRIEVLDLTYSNRVFGVDFMPYSTATDIGQQRMENDRSTENFAQILTRERDGLELNKAPLTGTWTRNPLRLRQRQRTTKELRKAPYALLFGHPIQTELLDGCTDPKLVWEFNEILKIKNVMARDNAVSPAKRLMEPFFENPVIDGILSVPPIDFDEWVRQKKILIIRSNALVSETATRGVLGAMIIRTLQTSAIHYSRTQQPLHADIFIDEAARLGIGSMEANYMAQCRKWGDSATLIYQSMPETPAFREIRQNIRRFEIFAQGSDESAEIVSKQIATMLLDNLKVKKVDERERTIVRGYNHRHIHTETKQKDHHHKTKGHTESEHVLTTPDLETLTDRTETLESLNDQYLMMKQKVRLLKTGERLVIDDTRVSATPEKVIQLEQKWPSDSSRATHLQEALERIRSRPHYHTPTFLPPVAAAVPKTKSVKGMKKS